MLQRRQALASADAFMVISAAMRSRLVMGGAEMGARGCRRRLLRKVARGGGSCLEEVSALGPHSWPLLPPVVCLRKKPDFH